jgi:hypothetical protein
LKVAEDKKKGPKVIPMEEKRKCPRWKIDNRAKIQLEGAEAAMDCMIHDINFKGARISLAQRLAADTFFKLSIILSEAFVIHAEAWVGWHKPVDGHNIYGIYFTKISYKDKEKIYCFMRQHYPKEMHRQWWDGIDEKEGGETMEDKRIFQRMTAKLNVKYLDLESGREGEARTCDISAKGIGLVSGSELKARAPLEMWLKVPDRDEPLYTRGEVVWSKEVSSTEYRSGINLERADLLGLSRALRAA